MARVQAPARNAPTKPAPKGANVKKPTVVATVRAARLSGRPLSAEDAATPKDSASFGWFRPTAEGFVTLYKAPVLTQVGWIKNGLGARDAKAILGQLRVPQGEALTALRIPVATMNRKAKTNAPLSPAEGERVLGFGRLLGQIQTMVQESGNPKGFDASAWLSAWMSAPVPALGGARPLDLVDTMTGQALVSQALSQMQSGAYA
jgi:putative toxin-antitoxin system antitoxin component (TIGR02293 family)